jgi:hypothetical protein
MEQDIVAARNLVPGEEILTAIFTAPSPSSIEILANNWTTCTFRAKFDIVSHPVFPNDLVVRLETSVGNLQVVTALQNAAALAIPEHVPKKYAVGKAVTASGKDVEYTVIQYVSDTEVLESVWPDLPDAQKSKLVSAVADAVKRLQKVRFEDARVQQLLQQTPFLDDGSQKAFGGPRDGYSQDLYDFLANFVAKHQKQTATTSSIKRTTEGVRIQSAQSPDQEFTFTYQELLTISRTAALSHNDLEPRNILVRRICSADPASEPQYEQAAIMDWEMAGFMPFTFESGWKDGGLGSSSIYWDWYKPFKQETRHLVPTDECFQKLLKALHFIVEAKRESMKKNVNAEFYRR